MNVTVIKEELHTYLESADEQILKALYNFVEDDIKQSFSSYSDEFKEELDKRIERYKRGEEMIDPEELERKIQQVRNSRR